jgi:hypothetical protein
MRRVAALALLAIAPGAFVGCESDEVARVLSQDVQIGIQANAASVDQFRVWDLFEDTDGDGIPDDTNGNGVDGDTADVSLWCERSGTLAARSSPWTYSLRINVIRNGEFVETLLTSEDAQSAQFNRAPYDSDRGTHPDSLGPVSLTHAAGTCAGSDPSIVCNPNGLATNCGSAGCLPVGQCDGNPLDCNSDGDCVGQGGSETCVFQTVTRIFKWSNANPGPGGNRPSKRFLTASSREVMASTRNAVSDACAGDPVCQAELELALPEPPDPMLGICPGRDTAGNAAIDPGNPLSHNTDTETIFAFEVEKGDTILVEARRSNTPPAGGIVFYSLPALRSRFFIDGQELQSDEVDGSLNSPSNAASPSVTYSYTTQ